MAVKANELKTMLKIMLINNITAVKSTFISPLISAEHGCGKTAILGNEDGIAKDLGGATLTIDGAILKEGEITGLPLPRITQTKYGEKQICDFAPHHTIARIMNLEQIIYEKANTEGFLEGKLRIIDNKTYYEDTVYEKESTWYEDAIKGDINQFKFGENLPFDIKLKLLESGEIRPIILFIDELNRADKNAMQELMNILLDKSVNGYRLPWWVATAAAMNPGSQNSAYNVNIMDPAHMDRFAKIRYNLQFDQWSDYALATNHNRSLIQAIAMGPEAAIFKGNNNELKDSDEQTPSPRSWSAVSTIMNHYDRIMDSKYFTNEERDSAKDIFREILNAIVGESAARQFMANLNNSDLNVKPEDIFTGKESKIADGVMSKLTKQRPIHKKLTLMNVIDYLAAHIEDIRAYKKGKTKDDQIKFANYSEQLKTYFNDVLDSSLKSFLIKYFMRNVAGLKTSKNGNLYIQISAFFATEYSQILKMYNTNFESLQEDDKK